MSDKKTLKQNDINKISKNTQKQGQIKNIYK